VFKILSIKIISESKLAIDNIFNKGLVLLVCDTAEISKYGSNICKFDNIETKNPLEPTQYKEFEKKDGEIKSIYELYKPVSSSVRFSTKICCFQLVVPTFDEVDVSILVNICG
jgi:hypothetical protein